MYTKSISTFKDNSWMKGETGPVTPVWLSVGTMSAAFSSKTYIPTQVKANRISAMHCSVNSSSLEKGKLWTT